MNFSRAAPIRVSNTLGTHGATQPPLRLAGLLLVALLVLYVALGWNHAGISNDEEVQHIYGRLLLDFYFSGFGDHSAFEYRNLYLYGGMFDLIAALLERLGASSVWDVRHLLSALFGLAGVLGAWRLGCLLGGSSAGLLAALLLSLTGAWSGAIFTHTKDVPFATCMVWVLYYTTRLTSELPAIRQRTAVALGIALGCAFGLRVGALFAVLTVAVTLLAGALRAGGGSAVVLRRLGGWGLALAPAALVAVALTALFWPWSVMAPGNLIAAATHFSHYTFDLNTIVDGASMKVGEVPRDYLLAYLLVRLPELVLIGLALAIGGRPWQVPRLQPVPDRRAAPRGRWPVHLPLVLAIALPIGFAWLDKPTLYNGIRHFLFLLPPIAVASALGWRILWQTIGDWRPARLAVGGAFGLLAFGHLVSLAQLHPYEYTYYNRLAGGIEGAAGRWELDYWSLTTRDGAEFLNRFVDSEDHGIGHAANRAPYPVAVCAEPLQAEAWLSPRFRVTRDWARADFFISTTNMACDRAMRGTPIHVIDRAGVPLGVVLDRRHLGPLERRPL